MAAAPEANIDLAVGITTSNEVELKIMEGDKALLKFTLPPDHLDRLVAELLRSEAEASKKRPRRDQRPPLDISSDRVCPSKHLAFAPSASDKGVIIAFCGDAIVGFELSLVTLGKAMDAFFQMTKRLSGQSGPPDDHGKDH